ncbi:MAG: hypothetical protein WD942_11705 [Dehalococcoidia bacterium]
MYALRMGKPEWCATASVGFLMTALAVQAAGQDAIYLWVGAVMFMFLALALRGINWWHAREEVPAAPTQSPQKFEMGRVSISGDHNVIANNTFGTIPTAAPTADGISAAEYQRQQGVLRGLYKLYLLSHDGITSEMAASIAPLPKAWVDAELAKLGETWRREEYRI